MTIDEVRALLRRECECAGSQAAWAKRHAFAPAFVSDVVNGRREPGARMLAALGLERVTEYRPLREKDAQARARKDEE